MSDKEILSDGQEENTSEVDVNTAAEAPNAQISEDIQTSSAGLELSSSADQKLYEEVLEKLDIVEKKSEIQEKIYDKSQLEDKAKQESINQSSQEQERIQSIIAKDFRKLQKLVQFGLINSEQRTKSKTESSKKCV